MIGPFGHLGSAASDYVDGRLDQVSSERAVDHLAGCPECRVLVHEQRRHRKLAISLESPCVSASLENRLLALASQPPGDEPNPPWSEPAETSGRAASHRARTRFVMVTASFAGLGLLAAGTLFVIGGRQSVAPEALTAAAITGQPESDASALARRAVIAQTSWPGGWAQPQSLPDGVHIVSSSTSPEGVLTIELEIDGEYATLRERHGELNLADVEVERSLRVGDIDAHLIDGWWVAAAGGEVLAVTGSDETACLEVLSAFGAAESDGVADRIARGWRVLLGG